VSRSPLHWINYEVGNCEARGKHWSERGRSYRSWTNGRKFWQSITWARPTHCRSVRSIHSATEHSMADCEAGSRNRPFSILAMPSSFTRSAIVVATWSRPEDGPRVVSVGYLALTRATGELKAPETLWRDWYVYFPWEDWRADRPAIVDTVIAPALKHSSPAQAQAWNLACVGTRARVAFGLERSTWMKKGFSSDTNSFTKPDLWRKPAGTDAQAKFDVPLRSAIR